MNKKELAGKVNRMTVLVVLVAILVTIVGMKGHLYNESILIFLVPLAAWKLCRMAFADGQAGMRQMLHELKGLLDAAVSERRSTVEAVLVILLFTCGMHLQKEIHLLHPLSWVMAVLFALLFLHAWRESDKRLSIWQALFSILFSLLMAGGNLIHIADRVQSTGARLWLAILVAIAGWYPVWYVSLWVLHEICQDSSEKIYATDVENRSYYWLYFGGMLLCWLPYFLAFFPGVLSSDSVSQVQQVVGELPSSNHHPWIHTQLIGLCYNIGTTLFGTPNAGVAVYSLVSMAIQAAAFAGICQYLRAVSMPKVIRVLSFIFLAACPFNAIYSITMWKDIPFTAFMIWFMLSIIGLKDNKWINFGVSGLLVCLFRSNGIYCYLFTLLFLLWEYRKEWKKLLLVVSLVLAIFVGYKKVLLPSLHVVEPDTVESLSIPLQQLQCVVMEGGHLDRETEAFLSHIWDVERLRDNYYPHTSDPIKKLVRTTGDQEYLNQNMGTFFKLYIRTGIHNPYCYIRAFVEESKGYWYHKENDWIYQDTFGSKNELGITRQPLLPQPIVKLFEMVLRVCKDGFHVALSLALFTYAVILGVMESILKKQKIAVYMPLIGLVLTLMIATPRYADFRYVYAIFAALPLYLAYMLVQERD